MGKMIIVTSSSMGKMIIVTSSSKRMMIITTVRLDYRSKLTLVYLVHRFQSNMYELNKVIKNRMNITLFKHHKLLNMK